jgi:hypothetical protein
MLPKSKIKGNEIQLLDFVILSLTETFMLLVERSGSAD